MGINRWEASEFSKIVRIFERMGDHCLLISNLILEFEGKPITPKSALLGVIPLWHKSMKLLISNLRKYKINEVHEAKSKLSDAIKNQNLFQITNYNIFNHKLKKSNIYNRR